MLVTIILKPISYSMPYNNNEHAKTHTPHKKENRKEKESKQERVF